MTKIKAAIAALLMAGTAAFFGATPAQADANVLPPHTGIMAPKGLPGVVPDSKAKSAVNSKLLAGPFYFYAYANQTVANSGFQANIRVEKPFVKNTDFHSLHQLSIQSALSGSINAIEFGWNVDNVVNGDYNPHLFGGCRINGVFQGYNAGCGYIDEAANPINLGSSLLANVGTAKRFDVRFSSNAWWVGYDGSWVGRFLASSWTTPTFNIAGAYQAFGEVAAATTTPCTKMGNGLQGSTHPGPPIPGYVASGTYFDAAGTGQSTLTNMSFGATDNTKYSVGPIAAPTSPFYTRSGGQSGPGWNAAGTATSTSATACV